MAKFKVCALVVSIFKVKKFVSNETEGLLRV
jgi:hypothetical protein